METIQFAPSDDSRTCLVVLERNGVRCFSLDDRSRWTVGRVSPETTPDIPLASPIASRTHGEFASIDGQWFYCDRRSLNGTLYNGARIKPGLNGRARPVMLQNGDVLRIDLDSGGAADPRGVWMLFSTESIQGEWRYYSLAGRGSVRIGRDPARCDLVQPLPYISAQHARITLRDGTYFLFDCGSSAGTWLNGQPVRDPVPLREKDRISICDCHFIFTGAGLIYNDRSGTAAPLRQARGPVVLSAEIRSKRIRDPDGRGERELFRNVRLELRAGELTALLGGPGANTAALMSCLSGAGREGVSGSVRLLGEDFYRGYDRLKCLVGIVPRNNALYESLTVEETLKIAAAQRLPGDIGRDGVIRQVDRTLQDLGLEHRRRTPIGLLAAGERKRVGIGMELISGQELLLLDGPDSGLDLPAQEELFAVLRDLARRQGNCVLARLRGASGICLFDQVLLLTSDGGVGRLAFAGTPEEAMRRFQPRDLARICGAEDRYPIPGAYGYRI